MIKRPRRLRKTEILRKMVRETRIDQASLIYPMFVRDGEGIREEIPSMAGQYRYSVDRMYEELEKLSDAGVGAVMLFGIPDHKDEKGSQAYAEDGVIQRALWEAKKDFPIFTILRTSAFVSIPLTDTAGCLKAVRWTMTPLWNFWLRRPSPMCRPVRTWSLLPT